MQKEKKNKAEYIWINVLNIFYVESKLGAQFKLN